MVGTDSDSYDKDGNLLVITDSNGKVVHGMTWDANDRMRNTGDASGSPDYTYAESGQQRPTSVGSACRRPTSRGNSNE